MNLSSHGTKPQAGLQQLMSIVVGIHLLTAPGDSLRSLAMMSVHVLNDSPHTERLTLLAERTKELVLSQDLAITIQM